MIKTLKTYLFLVLLCMLSGLATHLAWPGNHATLLLFIAFIPLFFAIDTIDKFESKIKIVYLLIVAFIAHYAWTSLSLGWLKSTSPKTYELAILIDATTFALMFLPTYFIRNSLGKSWQWTYTITSWLALEFINQNWPLGAPYFAVGGGFGMYPQIIQFYEYVGVEGGSLFLLICNLGFYFLLKSIVGKKSVKNSLLFTFVGILPFILSSLHLFDTNLDDVKKIRVAAVHSFLETYANDSHNHPERTVEELWKIQEKENLSGVDLVLWPETIISNLGWITNLQSDLAYKSITKHMEETPRFSLCTGGYSYSAVPKDPEDPYIAIEKARNIYYKAHNVAVTFDTNGLTSIRSKELFIPFQERIPYLKQLPFLKNWVDFVGANTMVCPYEKSKNVHKTLSGISFVPVLCFESTYPYRMSQNAQEGQLSVILANENWNKDLKGSDQYLYNNIGIAIQSRTSIARSSNSGISAMIDPTGTILKMRKGRNIGIIVQDLPLKEDNTVYETIAGLFYKLGLIISLGLISWSLLRRLYGAKKTSN